MATKIKLLKPKKLKKKKKNCLDCDLNNMIYYNYNKKCYYLNFF